MRQQTATGETAGPLMPRQRAVQRSAWFQADPTPVLLLGAGGMVLDLNRSALALLERAAWLRIADERLVLSPAPAQQALLRTLADVVSGLSGSSPLIVRLEDGGCRRFELDPIDSAPPHRAYLSLRRDPAPRPDLRALIQAFHLTPQEGEVLRALAEGLSPREAADLLAISERTVRAHLRSLYAKLSVRGLQDLVRFTARMTA